MNEVHLLVVLLQLRMHFWYVKVKMLWTTSSKILSVLQLLYRARGLNTEKIKSSEKNCIIIIWTFFSVSWSDLWLSAICSPRLHLWELLTSIFSSKKLCTIDNKFNFNFEALSFVFISSTTIKVHYVHEVSSSSTQRMKVSKIIEAAFTQIPTNL